jgi:uracil-DNA glycosylase
VTEPDVLTQADPARWAVHPSWQALVQAFWRSPDGHALVAFLNQRIASGARIFPPEPLRALLLTPLTAVRVVVLGQDPYPTEGDALGLAFAMNPANKMPRSLKNIAIELKNDLGAQLVVSEDVLDLAKWVDEGIFLLNRALTTNIGSAGAHLGKVFGWEEFTLMVVKQLLARQKVVLLLWGNSAKSIVPELEEYKENFIAVHSAHPSPLSARNGFFGSKPFSRANQALTVLGLQPIDWTC